MRPIVLLDCDGPLADFTTHYLVALARVTNGKALHTAEEVDRWAIHDCQFFHDAAVRFGVEREVLKRKVDAEVTAPGFCAHIPVQKGSQNAVAELRSLAQVYVVTSPWNSGATWMHERERWLLQHFDIGHKSVFHCSSKFLVRGDVFVDDKADHVATWAKAWPDSRAFLFDMHHNKRDDVGHSGRPSARGGWDEVIRHVRSLEGAI